ncbi:MAG: arylsulfatase A-like enzyme [Mariniblastus sp.]|jgi:arylsulfatase A-like enzyme
MLRSEQSLSWSNDIVRNLETRSVSEGQSRKKITAPNPPTYDPQQSPTYAAMVHSLDDAVGSLLDALDAEGIADQTVIIFYSDNGGNIHCGLEETDTAG